MALAKLLSYLTYKMAFGKKPHIIVLYQKQFTLKKTEAH